MSSVSYYWWSFSSTMFHPPRSSPPVSNSYCVFTGSQSLYAGYCTLLLFIVLYCKNVFFFLIFVFVFHVLFEKYYKPITVQYYITKCVSWVSRLTLSNLMNKSDLWTCSWNCTHFHVGDLLYMKYTTLYFSEEYIINVRDIMAQK